MEKNLGFNWARNAWAEHSNSNQYSALFTAVHCCCWCWTFCSCWKVWMLFITSAPCTSAPCYTLFLLPLHCVRMYSMVINAWMEKAGTQSFFVSTNGRCFYIEEIKRNFSKFVEKCAKIYTHIIGFYSHFCHYQ